MLDTNLLQGSRFILIGGSHKHEGSSMSKSITMLLLLSALVSGCAPCNPYMGTEPFLKQRYEAGDNFGLPATYDAASSYYLYAQLSTNSYADKSEHFTLPSTASEVSSFDEGYGLQGKVFEIQNQDDIPNEVVIAFRGTEGFSPAGFMDWIWGNFLGKQYRLSDSVIQRTRAQYPNSKLTAVGHSLGGGLALHASVCFDSVTAITFNPSFRLFRCGEEKPNKRVIIAETDEILSIQRMPWKDPSRLERHEKFYCSTINNHSMFNLARCLTHVAAAINIEAEKSIRTNPVAACSAPRSNHVKLSPL